MVVVNRTVVWRAADAKTGWWGWVTQRVIEGVGTEDAWTTCKGCANGSLASFLLGAVALEVLGDSVHCGARHSDSARNLCLVGSRTA